MKPFLTYMLTFSLFSAVNRQEIVEPCIGFHGRVNQGTSFPFKDFLELGRHVEVELGRNHGEFEKAIRTTVSRNLI